MLNISVYCVTVAHAVARMAGYLQSPESMSVLLIVTLKGKPNIDYPYRIVGTLLLHYFTHFLPAMENMAEQTASTYLFHLSTLGVFV